jgi:hypothetical protein
VVSFSQEAYEKELRTLELLVIFRNKEHKFRFAFCLQTLAASGLNSFCCNCCFFRYDLGVTVKSVTQDVREKLGACFVLVACQCVRLSCSWWRLQV